MNSRWEILKPFEENKEYILKRTAEGIEKHRKGTARLRVTDENGKPIPNARVQIRQVRHDFRYGANIFMLDEFESEEKNTVYRDRFKEVCNTATLPFYWRDLEPVQGQPRYAADSPKIYRRPALDLCLDYCRESRIEPKEHCLVYETWMPDWVDKQDLPRMKQLIEARIRDLAAHYADKIPCWEVTNETLYCLENSSALYNSPDMIEWSFACAEKYLKDNTLVINDAHCNIWEPFNEYRSAYYMQIQRALEQGARIDSIGMQFHMFYSREQEKEATKLYYDPQRIYRVLDRYSDFVKPIQITELTIPAYSSDPEDEAIQAELIKWLYTIWFGHGSVDTILYWNLVDGYAAFAPQGDMTAGENYYHGGLMRFDMSPKPAFEAIKQLFDSQWHTQLEARTDESGAVEFSGFYGDYEITVSCNGKTETVPLHLSKGESNTAAITL